jgi:multidrug efflux system outer membrane protein
VVGGCAKHQVDEEANLLEVEVPPGFSEAATGAALPSDWNLSWWETFQDEHLNQLIETGLASNLGLQQYVARIEQATALARQAGASLCPTLDLSGIHR